MLEVLKESNKTIGVKQTTKALNQDQVKTLYIAKDADDHLIDKLKDMADTNSIEIIYTDSMKELGKACGIDVGAATVAILK